MVTRTIVRTPRRRKVWATRNWSSDGGYAFSTTSNSRQGLLASYLTDTGLAETQGVTVMRVVGSMWLGALGAAASAATDIVSIGFAWNLETQGGAGARPDPMEDGMRRQNWLQEFQLSGVESTSTTEVGLPLTHPEHSQRDFDITQMRKQPNAGADFSLFILPEIGAYESGTVGLFGWVKILLALP